MVDKVLSQNVFDAIEDAFVFVPVVPLVVRIGVAGTEGLGQFFEQLALAGCEFLGNLYIDGNPQLANANCSKNWPSPSVPATHQEGSTGLS